MKVGLGRAFARVLAGALALALCAGCGQRGEEPATRTLCRAARMGEGAGGVLRPL